MKPALLSLAFAAALTSSAVIGNAQISPATTTSSSLDLTGSDGHHLKITVKALESLPQSTVHIHNPHTGVDETYEGVELSLLLSRLDAPLGKALHGKALAMYVVAEGTDHYRAVYSLAEIDPAFHGGAVIVAERMNGHPLDAKSGPLKLVNTEDKRPARCVHNLASIQLKSAAE